MRRSTGREKLARVLHGAGDLVTVQDASESLGVSRQEAAKTLWRWSQQGWFRRLKRGVYARIPVDSPLLEQPLPEPWVLIPEVFSPAYVGGWSAAEHWDLTEQIFRTVLVYTASSSRPREQTFQGITYILKRVKREKIFGVRPVWYGKIKVEVSDIHRTVVDMLDDPSVGGGIRHARDCIENYLSLDQADVRRVIEYADQLGNGAVFKRLGFILSLLDADETFLVECRSRLTTGNAKLDPSLSCPRLLKRWNLWIPRSWEPSFHD